MRQLGLTVCLLSIVSLAGTANQKKASSDVTQGSTWPPRQSYQHSLSISEEYDRFRDVTTVRLEPFPLKSTSGAEIGLVATVSGDFRGTTPSEYASDVLVFIRPSGSATPSGSGLLDILVDGKPIEVIPGNNVDISPMDRISGSWLRSAALLKMVNGRTAEGRVYGREFLFTPEQLEALRDLTSRLTPGSSTPAQKP